MTETVEWRDDGLPRSPRFNDIYHSAAGAQAQAQHVFLGGCGLPAAWARMPQWRILETGFGFGLNFLSTWAAWRADPERPRLLHFVSIEAFPVAAADLLRAAAAYPDLQPLARELAAQWHGLLPGLHRLWLDGGRALLTLCIGDVQPMLRSQRFEADSIFLDGFSPQRNPQMWSNDTLLAVSRFARRGTRIATWSVARTVIDALTQNGFQLSRAPGLPPKRDCLQGVYDPGWQPRQRHPVAEAARPGRCAVIGAGLGGAAVAASLARRGWQVEVIEAGRAPAAGASSLPAGLMAPHVSPDDALLSRLTRAGIRATWQQLQHGLIEGRDWRGGGVLERRAAADLRLPAGWSVDGPNESWIAGATQLQACDLPADTNAIWHARAGWVRPRALIEAWLGQPGIRLRTDCRVARIERKGAAEGTAAGWLLDDAEGRLLAEADRVVIAAGHESRALAPGWPLQPVRGQVEWGALPALAGASRLPALAVNGMGHLISGVPDADGESGIWITGASFDRDSQDLAPSATDTQYNRERLASLHPAAARLIDPIFEGGEARHWTGVRCAAGDRRPLVGPLSQASGDGIWLCTALGSRGLSFAALCAELLAARWHAEPLPLAARLAEALDARRAEPKPHSAAFRT